jgi:hypothetical protein
MSMPAPASIDSETWSDHLDARGAAEALGVPNQKHKRPANASLLRERLKGLEPSTFCMATRFRQLKAEGKRTQHLRSALSLSGEAKARALLQTHWNDADQTSDDRGGGNWVAG